jgi:2-oxoglutarate ferredoxin oxidoreductase subunit delta
MNKKSKLTTITIDPEKCKGCELCISVCPQNSLEVSKKSNPNGYFPAQVTNTKNCTGCASCAIICPDTLIEIYKK